MSFNPEFPFQRFNSYNQRNTVNKIVDSVSFIRAQVEVSDYIGGLTYNNKEVESETNKILAYEVGYKAAEKVKISEVTPKKEFSRVFKGELYAFTRQELFDLLMQAFKAGVEV